MPASRSTTRTSLAAPSSRGSSALPVVDSQSGFRLIRASLLREVRLTGTSYEIETEMLIKLCLGATPDRVTVRRVCITRAHGQDPSILEIPPERAFWRSATGYLSGS